MTKLSTLKDKINKTLEYCDYVEDLSSNNISSVLYLVEIEIYQQCAESEHIVYSVDRKFLYDVIYQAVLDAKQYSQYYNCLSSVKVYIKTYNSEGVQIDEDPIDEYEIFFENGIEVR